MTEKTKTTSFDRHYIYHPAWAARVLSKTKPKFHVDISSSLSFCSIISAFMPVRFYDYRPANLKLSNLSTGSADLTVLKFKNNSVLSLSCMHTVEHIGLGRYGDQLDPDGDLKAIMELKRVLAAGGSLLFVVPIGKPRIVFNAHRIYSYTQILSYFQELTLKEFALLPDPQKGDELVYNPTKRFCDQQKYACGCFHFMKL
jgi:SAM-dependent methyltransferase